MGYQVSGTVTVQFTGLNALDLLNTILPNLDNTPIITNIVSDTDNKTITFDIDQTVSD